MEKIKRKSGVKYRESIRINGRTIKSPVFSRKTDCIQWLAQQRSRRYENTLYGDNSKLKSTTIFEEYAGNWIIGKKAAGLSKSTIDNYESYLNVHLVPFFKGLDMKRISRVDVESFQAHFSKTHNAKGTNNIMTALKAIFSEAVKDGFLVKSPAAFMKKLSEDNPVESYWTKAEIDQFFRGSIHNPLYDLFLIALNTGMRRGELAGLKWDRVDLSLNQITISRTRDVDGLKERTKTKLKRVIPMNQLVKMTLLKLFQERKGSEFVFVRSDDSPLEVHHIYRDFGKAQAKAGITNKIRFHDLRHTFASQFMMNNGNVFDLQKILGHTDIKMTMRYAHYSPEHLQKAMQGFELGQSNELAQNLPTPFSRKSQTSLESVAVNS